MSLSPLKSMVLAAVIAWASAGAAQAGSAQLALHETVQGDVTQIFNGFSGWITNSNGGRTDFTNSYAASLYDSSGQTEFSVSANSTSLDLYADLFATAGDTTLEGWNGPIEFVVGPAGGSVSIDYQLGATLWISSQRKPTDISSADFLLSSDYDQFRGIGTRLKAVEPGAPAFDAATQTLQFAGTGAEVHYFAHLDFGAFSNGYAVDPVPEPETWALMGMGLVAAVAAARKRRRA